MAEAGKIDAELIIFDLDGTLIDSSRDIAWCANKTLVAMGRPEMGVPEIVGHIGWGVRPLLEKLMPGASEETLTEARRKFLELYGGRLVAETTLYPGALDTVAYFAGRKKLAIVTNKPIGLTLGIIGILGLKGFFGLVLGGDSLPNKKPHPEPIEKAIRDSGARPERTVVVGDSPVDCEAGRAAGAFTIGASYGFRGREELLCAGCDIIIDSLAELRAVID